MCIKGRHIAHKLFKNEKYILTWGYFLISLHFDVTRTPGVFPNGNFEGCNTTVLTNSANLQTGRHTNTCQNTLNLFAIVPATLRLQFAAVTNTHTHRKTDTSLTFIAGKHVSLSSALFSLLLLFPSVFVSLCHRACLFSSLFYLGQQLSLTLVWIIKKSHIL